MEEMNSVNAEPVAAVEPQPTQEGNATVQGETQAEPTAQQPAQSENQNRAFADYRRQAERATKADATIAKLYSQPITIGDRTFSIKTSEDLAEAQEYQEQINQKQKYIDKGIDPDMINKLIDENPAIIEAKQLTSQAAIQKVFNTQADSLFKEFPNLQAADVPNEVLKMNKDQGIPLTIAYKAFMYGNVNKEAEQTAIKNLKQNQNTSPGSLSSEAVPKSKFSQLSREEKSKQIKEVLRGERTALD